MTSITLFSAPSRLLDLARTGRLRLPASISDTNRRFIDSRIYPLAAILFAFITPLLTASLAAIPLVMYLMARSGGRIAPEELLTQIDLPTLLVANFLPIYFLVWAWLYVFERRPFRTVGLEWSEGLYKYLRGLLIGFVMFTAVVVVFALFGLVAIESINPTRSTTATLNAAIVMLMAWIIQGGAEEVLARGFLLPVIGVRWGTAVGVTVSSLLFAALHLLNPNLSLLGVVNLALFGLFAAVFALSEGGIWGVCAIHTAWNWTQGTFFGLQVSGIGLESAVMFNLMEDGPDLFTGGQFGPEGGLVTTAVLVAGTALVLLRHRRITRAAA